MESIDSDLAARIRQDIILGSYQDGERLSEAQLCDTHNVSRTPVRLALRLLEREGIINRAEGRGYLVQNPTVEDILKAVEVRGHLESLAARLMAQNLNRLEHIPKLIQAPGAYTLEPPARRPYFQDPGKNGDCNLPYFQDGRKSKTIQICPGSQR